MISSSLKAEIFLDKFQFHKVIIWYMSVICLSVGLATEVPKLTHYWVVLFHPRA